MGKSNNKAVEPLKAPSWGKALSKDELIAVPDEYGALAGDLKELADQIEQADKIFLNGYDPDDNPIEIFYGEKLHSQYGDGCLNGDIAPQQSKDTVKPVMQILYSATQLKLEIVRATSTEEAGHFYFDLINALRYFVYKPTSYSSGDTVVEGTYTGDSLKPYDPDNPLKTLSKKQKRNWLYMGAERKDGPTTAKLIDKLNDWQCTLNKSTENSANSECATIPEENRTPPITLNRMAKVWGGDMTPKKLRGLIDTGRVKAIALNRQSYIFDTSVLPKEAIEKLKT